MEVRILGALDVLHEGRPLALGGGRQRELLALLVVERNRPISGDRIVEELWNGDAPATAPKVVQNLVSQLRRGLPASDMLHTRGHAYELELDDDSLDAARFELLLEQGRRELAAGEPERAASTLREALALWRGPALGDFAEHPWARNESARLEERRLVAFERRIDADLALGRHADVVGELEAAVAGEPLREGLRAQLMLALYRSGRQAEALAAYADARRTLVDELGIEPGPALTRLHEAILRQDEELDAPSPEPPVRPARDRRRRRAGLLLLAGGALLALAVAVILLTRDEPANAPAGAGQLVALDAATGRIERQISAGRTPAELAVQDGDLWAVDSESRTLLRVDASSDSVETLVTGATPVDVAAGADAIWVVNGRRRENSQALAPILDEVVRLDPATRREVGAAALPVRAADASGSGPAQLAASSDAVWAITAQESVVRIDPVTAEITNTTRGVRALAVAAGGAGVWVLGVGGTLAQLDERTGRVLRRERLPTRDPGAFTVGDDAVWVGALAERKLWRVGSERAELIGSVDIDAIPTAIVSSGRSVWLADAIAGTVTAVDAAAMRVIRTRQLEGVPRALALDGDTVWVALTGTNAAPTSQTVAGVEPLPASMCEPVVAGRDGKADALLVSDLPLQGDSRLAATQMARAITFVLRERRFRAGRLRLAFQSCDDALAGTGLYDEAKCAANGRAYAANPDVIGVIGTLNSPCAVNMLPELNRADGGPLGMISPLNSYTGLTRQLDGPDEPKLAEFYPTGRRNFVRIYPTDDAQGAALAQLMLDRGHRRPFVLEDGDAYSRQIADRFVSASRRLGLDVVARVTWEPTARDYQRLAERVARSGADAILVSGLIANDAGRLIRDLRARLGDGIELMGPDGLVPLALLPREAGRAAHGMTLTALTLPLEQLPPAGAAFVERFSRSQPGMPIDPFAVYAAHATDVLLDAIERSDGTRGSVIEELFRTNARAGLTGPVDFDARGDIVQGAVTVLRVTDGEGSNNVGSVQGAQVEGVTYLSPDLAEP